MPMGQISRMLPIGGNMDGRIDVLYVAVRLILTILVGWRANSVEKSSSSILFAPRLVKLE